MYTNELELVYQAKSLNANSNEKRLFNIAKFSKLDRRLPLAFMVRERLLLLHETEAGEKIYIRYPGKESARLKNRRPLDFRPVLEYPDGSFMKDLSFGDIWDDITALHSNDKQTICELAALFFRIAFMVNHKKDSAKCMYKDIDMTTKTEVSNGEIDFEWYKPCFSKELLTALQDKIGLIRGASLEAYLFYNDLLVQNEDCKYYYRNVIEDIKPWNPKNGRVNTVLSHLSVIQYLQGSITFSQITMRFQRGMGVAPLSMSEVETVTNGLIKKG